MLLDYGFTSEQLVGIYEFLQFVKEVNSSIKSNSKIDGLEYFVDNNKNFYASYCYSDYTSGYLQSELKYVSVNPFGGTIDLNKIYNNPEDIVKKLSRYKKISLA
jgi:hypothetical protein